MKSMKSWSVREKSSHWLKNELKKFEGLILISVLNVLVTLIVLLAYITQWANIQLIVIQKIYWSLDTLWVIIRTVILFFISISGIAIIYVFKLKFILRRSLKFELLTIIIGLILGLCVFYGYSCCDTPVSILMGFPLSWLRGISEAQNRLPLPTLQYLYQNIGSIKWYVDYFCLFVDILFWYDVGLIGYVIVNRKTTLLLPQKKLL